MFINNIGKISNKFYRCNKELGEKIIKEKIPLLGRIDEDMIFANTKKLKEVLKKIQGGKK